MEIVENTLDSELDTVLDRPLFCHFAQIAEAGPRVSPLWFLWEEDVIWNIAQLQGRSYPERVRRRPRTAIAITDFEPRTGHVEHVGMRGTASLESYDQERAGRLLEKYLGSDENEWPKRFVGLDPTDYRLIKFEPDTIVARDQSYPAPPEIGDQ
ncbi:pyridoxamine 5'-phosphate oxidase family protein [Natrinema altunense]|uniref:Pyridoxamine 5'-phosphate oxidase-like FMN-binding protein n=1 Tax=Natrinema altunense (strain JCM 12890 / CGMCC 1.3731 / AJ2) TaxID=1227494 RepID=L9ZUH6_NATA2|nr:hypothetical protein [Natrinema altunense]ELY89237.1 pyridoxamine 5'-phosphate oxidase-like FMN-binding protein [Natrinema altunense JCM 12890]